MNRTGSSVPTFELGEWQSRLIDGENLTPADRRLSQDLKAGEEGRLVIDELLGGVRVTARSWVGLVHFERFAVRIVPKLAGDNLGLVDMIEFATGLDALRRTSSARTLHAEGAGLMDLLALLLAEAAEAILRGGIFADYVEQEDDLPVLRGRLLSDQQMFRRFGQVDRLVCRFDEHERDIVENQLLAAALGECATRITHESVRRRVRRVLAVFQEVCRTDELDLQALRHCGVAYNRLNDHYRDAHALAWLLLDGLGTRDPLASGKTHCFAFLIDMNRLFEMFVFHLVERLLIRTELRAYYQRGDRSIIVNASTNQPYARVIPDLLIEARDPAVAARVAVDAKYKLYDERKLSSGDVYQSFLYAFAFGGVAGHLPTALLLYPSSTQSSQVVRLRVRSAQTSAAAEITALGLSIPAALAEITHNVGGPVTQAIIEAIQQGIGGSRTAAA